jgi:hypothetical protein
MKASSKGSPRRTSTLQNEQKMHSLMEHSRMRSTFNIELGHYLNVQVDSKHIAVPSTHRLNTDLSLLALFTAFAILFLRSAEAFKFREAKFVVVFGGHHDERR